jgi:NADH-quinone oxidoreductase subunit J
MSALPTLGFAAIDWRAAEGGRWVLAAALLVVALVMSLPSGQSHGGLRRAAALLSGFAGLALLWWSIPRWDRLTAEAGFWVLALITIISAAATISSRSPVYSAIWFAVSLLGTAGLLLFQGAQFLGIATVAVYAGAIVVTFLFVLMLAQPEGHAYYDRVGWRPAPRFLISLTSVVFALILVCAATHPDASVLEDRQALLAELETELAPLVPGLKTRGIHYEARADQRLARLTVAVPHEQREVFQTQRDAATQIALRQVRDKHPDWQIGELTLESQDLHARDHTAHLGSHLFSRQLVAVQAAGALLLAALVGAVAIVGRTGALEPGPMR